MTKQELGLRGIVGCIARIRELSNLLIEEELAERGIKGILPAHGIVFGFLFQQDGPVPIKDVVAGVHRVKSTVTGILKTLERQGYVQKIPSREDSRVIHVRLTRKGRELQAPFEEISQKLLSSVCGNISKANRQLLVRLLGEVEENVRREVRKNGEEDE